MTEPTIDRATYDELKDTAGADFVAELVDTFLVEAPRLIDELRHAYDKRNADVFRRSAHSLKSNSNTFGARTLAALAKDLELGGFAPVVQGRRRAFGGAGAGIHPGRGGTDGAPQCVRAVTAPRAFSSSTTTRSTGCCSRAAWSCRAIASRRPRTGASPSRCSGARISTHCCSTWRCRRWTASRCSRCWSPTCSSGTCRSS